MEELLALLDEIAARGQSLVKIYEWAEKVRLLSDVSPEARHLSEAITRMIWTEYPELVR